MSQMLQLFIFFVMMMSVNGAVNVFFIGDSTSHKFYEYLRELCSKSQPDPRAVKDFSNDMYHDPIALICDTRHMHRIGFSMHWGVSDSHYHIAKVNHTSPGDTEYSVANIYTRVAEFQHRTAGGSKSVYIFLSNMWDVKRYEATFEANQSESSWVAEYKANYTKVALELKRLMKGNDVIYFQTMHNLARPYMLKVRALNQAVREVTKEHNLKLLDVEELLGMCHPCYLEDKIHFGKFAGKYLADHVYKSEGIM